MKYFALMYSKVFSLYESDGQDETWGNWLWNMMPSILAQDSEKGDLYKEELNPTFNIGFCVKQLEINLKVVAELIVGTVIYIFTNQCFPLISGIQLYY